MLALDGGNPVRTKPFSTWPVFDQEEEEALQRVLSSGKWWQFAYGEGVELLECGDGERSETSRFQEAFAAAHDCRYGIAAANGTATLELILRAADIGPGDEVIVPPYTFIATASAVLQIGAVPIFVDIDPETLNLDPRRIPEAITPRTRAIIPVHFGGQSADMDAIMAMAAEHNLLVIEDAAHAHGATWCGRKCGSLGHAGSFSFQASKNMTAGEGGMITTNDAALAAGCNSYLWAGREPGRPWYEHHRLGWNYRITEFQSALLSVQLSRLEQQTSSRDENGRYLTAHLEVHVPGLVPQRIDARITRASFHLFICRYNPDGFGGMPRDAFMRALAAEGIPCSGGYVHPLYRNPMFVNKDFWKGSFPCVAPFADAIDYTDFIARCPVSEALCHDAIWIPQNVFLGPRADMDDVIAAIDKIQHRG